MRAAFLNYIFKEEVVMKKLLAMVLALTLVLTLAVPLMAQADDLEEITIL